MLLIAAVCMLSIFTSYGIFLIIVIPALFAFLAVRRGFLALFGTLVVVVAACVLYWGLFWSAIYGLMILPPFAVLTYINKRKRASFESLLAVCASMLVALGLAAVVVYMQTGKDIVTVICDELAKIFEIAQPGSAEYNTMAVLGYADHLEDIATIAIDSSVVIDKAVFIPRAISWIRLMLNAVLPSFILSFSLFGGVTDFLLTRSLIRRAKGEVKDMKPFSQWEIPMRGLWGLVIIAVAIGGGSLLGLDLFAEALPILLELLAIIFLIQGTAFAVFLFQRRGAGTFSTTVMIIVLIFFLATIVILAGLAEQFLKLRKKMTENNSSDGF